VFDSIGVVADFVSPHWLAEYFPGKLRELVAEWADRHDHGKPDAWHGLAQAAGPFAKVRSRVAEVGHGDVPAATRAAHDVLLGAAGYSPERELVETTRDGVPVEVPVALRVRGASGEALHVLEAHVVTAADDLLAAELLASVTVGTGSGSNTENVRTVSEALSALFLTDDAPRYALVIAGGWLLLTDGDRWPDGKYLALDAETALARGDDKRTGEIAWHAGLWSADVLLPRDDAPPSMDSYLTESVKHAEGVNKGLREGLRESVELLADEVLRIRRERELPVEGLPDLPREMIRQSLRFLYRILFLLFAEARPELGVLPARDPDYAAGYGLDRLRELAQVELATAQARDGHHFHDSLRLLFRLVNEGHSSGGDGLSFEALRADLFDPRKTQLIDGTSEAPGERIDLRNEIVQQILQLLLLSKARRGQTRGYVSYAQLGINQLGAVYEGLMAYSGRFAETELAELALDPKDLNKGTWVVPVDRLHEYDESHYVKREDPDTGEIRLVRHEKGSFVFRQSGRDRQRSASYYTPEVLTRCVVKHALAELLDPGGGKTPAKDILKLTICEPALGSGAFLNEAVNQLARKYLDRIQEETGRLIPPERVQEEERKVRAHLALHQCYGVDLNRTAVELAEVSLWLNVMHPGLRGPWFGLHLQRGNSLIGARRAVYKGVPDKWHGLVPEDRPLSGDPIGEGEVHHFLLPAHGWGAVGSDKRAKELAEFEAERLRDWAKSIKRKPSAAQVKQLQALAMRVERVWELAKRRLEIAESEVARHIDVWGAEPGWLPESNGAVSREEIESALNDPDSMYQRLRLVMDAWCALWFWPVQVGTPVPPDLDKWIKAVEDILGVEPKAATVTVRGRKTTAGQDALGLFGDEYTWLGLEDIDQNERALNSMKPMLQVTIDHPWLAMVSEIRDREGFFHWELDFAPVFAKGGFDLQVGNPPWVRLDWKDDETLAESDAFFMLSDITEATFLNRRSNLLRDGKVRTAYLSDLASWVGVTGQLGSAVDHPMLSGIRTNLYMNFMETTWRSSSPSGTVGLLHPEGHFGDAKAGQLRKATYTRLRRHWQFRNQLKLFDEIDNGIEFSINIYARQQSPRFLNACNLHHPETIDLSLEHDGSGQEPNVQYPWGGWDFRPHRARVVVIDDQVLAVGAELFDPGSDDPLRARMVRPFTVEHLDVLRAFARQRYRMTDTGYLVSSGWNEKLAKEAGIIELHTADRTSWNEVILQGPLFSVATPLDQKPNIPCRSPKDYTQFDLEDLPPDKILRTNYRRACPVDRFMTEQKRWNDKPYSRYWRLCWRRMMDPGTERSLIAALEPPGPTHVDAVHSLILPTNSKTVAIVGLWASLPFDYLVKVGGKADVRPEYVDRFPAPLDHPATPHLLLRALRLNCLTDDYSPLWDELFEDGFTADSWTPSHQWRTPLGDITRDWTMTSPLRTEYDRRAALVEIDALAAIMLGITAEQLCAIYRAQFGVLRKYEYRMFFDAQGRKIAKETHARGWKQQAGDYELAEQWWQEYEESGEVRELPEELRDRYRAPLVKPDREAEMTTAYIDFTARLASLGAST
jgi:hypothetical protein